MEALIFVTGLVAGGTLISACLGLTRRFLSGKGGTLAAGLIATLGLSYLALHLAFEIAFRFVRTQIEPQWKAQGFTDHGPTSFVVILGLAMPFVYGVLVSGLAASVFFTMRRK